MNYIPEFFDGRTETVADALDSMSYISEIAENVSQARNDLENAKWMSRQERSINHLWLDAGVRFVDAVDKLIPLLEALERFVDTGDESEIACFDNLP